MNTNERFMTCPRCSGTGELPKFRHIEGGRCFLCEGEKVIKISTLTLPEKTTVCYQDNRNVTENDGMPWPESYRIERFSIVVNGGSSWPNGWDFVTAVTDDNREELRAVWVQAKKLGIECKAFHN